MGKRAVFALVGIILALALVKATLDYFTSTALPGGRQALWHAAARGNANRILALSVRPQDVNEQDPAGWTPLMLAAGMGHSKAVKALLTKGADPNVVEIRGISALMLAAARGYGDIARDLLGAGANAGATDKDGNTVLMYAAGGPSIPSAQTALLARVGHNENLIQPPDDKHAQIALDLLGHGARLDARNRESLTAVEIAGRAANRRVLAVLRAAAVDRSGKSR